MLALDNLSLSIEPGAIGLVGQNGAGKSTLIKILLGLVRHTAGKVRVYGSDVVPGTASGLRGRIGYMPESEGVVPGLNGIEYVGLAGELNGMPRKQSLPQGARDFYRSLAWRRRATAGWRITLLAWYNVSSWRPRWCMTPTCCFLMSQPRGWIPTVATAMLSLLKSLARRPGKSLVLSTHLLGDIERVCRHAIILEEGAVAASGTLDELLAGQPHAFLLRWKTGGDAADRDFLAALQREGAEATPGDELGQARAVVSEQWPTQRFFQLARECGVTLTGLEPEEMDLRTVYRRLVGMESAAPPVIGLAKRDESGVAAS